jgi:hypothetical protein
VVDTASGHAGVLKVFSDSAGSNFKVNVSAAGYLPVSVDGIVIKTSQTTKITVLCVRQTLTDIDIQPDTLGIPANTQSQLALYGVYMDGTTMLLDSMIVPVWTSRSSGVIGISGSGLVSSNTQTGTSVVTANVVSLGLWDSCLVRVVAPYQLPKYHWKLDETIGTTAADATGNGNTATFQNTPIWSAGKYGNALTLDGVNDYLSTSQTQTNPNVFTLSLWFKTTSATGGRLIGFGNAQTGQSGNYDRHLYLNNAGQVYFGCNQGGVKTLNTTAACNDNVWHFAAATLSGAGMALYIDGVLSSSDTAVTQGEAYNGYWKMGFDNLEYWPSVPTSKYFSGQLDDIRVYDKALSASDITLLMNDSTTYSPGGTADESISLMREKLALSTSPNPFNPNVTISVSGWKSGAELKVLDITGKVAADLSASLNGGSHRMGLRQVIWNASGYASGMYVVMVRNGKVELKRKVLLIR